MQVNGVFRLAKEAPEAAAGRSRGIFATRKKVRCVSAMYSDHFQAARVSARTRLRGRACQVCALAFSRSQSTNKLGARNPITLSHMRTTIGGR